MNALLIHPILCMVLKVCTPGFTQYLLKFLMLYTKMVYFFPKNMQLLQKRGTSHTPPAHCYHSQSNGKVETTVKIAKSLLHIMMVMLN